ncbi:MAG: hypothetical protein RSB50_07030 [Cetobacterium sp.]
MKKFFYLIFCILAIRSYSIDAYKLENGLLDIGFTKKVDEYDGFKDIHLENKNTNSKVRVSIFYNKNKLDSINFISMNYGPKTGETERMKSLGLLLYDFYMNESDVNLNKDVEKILNSIKNKKTDLIETKKYVIKGFNLGTASNIEIKFK